MITVKVDQGTKELCLIRIEAQEFNGDVIRYTAEFVVNRTDGTGIHSRVFEVPIKNDLQGNVLYLLRAAINSLDKEALEEGESDG